MTKRKRRTPKRKRSSKRSSKKYLYLSFALLILTLLIVGLSLYLYRLGYQTGLEESKSHQSSSKSSLAHIKKRERAVLKKVLQSPLSEIEDYRQNLSSSQSSFSRSSSSHATSSTKSQRADKPRLAIIIDDVAYGSQVRTIQALGMPINISLFPPTPTHPNTPKYAQRLSHYMIHLPMEAMHYTHEEHYTLRSTTSTQAMDRYIATLRKKFPRARCINNHTGSRFTADYEAMKRLIGVLDRYRFCFLDSRTTPKTQVPRLMRDLHRRYLARNIFLDNDMDVAKIKAQLEKAVRLAKRQGLAIAIGHPHAKTLEAIRRSKGILKEVRLIYVDELVH